MVVKLSRVGAKKEMQYESDFFKSIFSSLMLIRRH